MMDRLRYKGDPSLGIWVRNQNHYVDREWFIERKKRLDELGFTWSDRDKKVA